ncbi:hypothetical protein KP509_1Z058500 [Ceratopteris richardii]|nr:hypothetical protein KP509_1Z058200 [Ceratopteris richardii]KAH6558529.1 hypothetical protein KP509_1Z058300 [Ceratopteris richardii]KAH6558530.1 hypothetical protein KP509_1Z058400 [Ceratopteris richardii]KAH6558531.1 hypothetical protein KP509_1Z058500 [Ceratopteris richardii]
MGSQDVVSCEGIFVERSISESRIEQLGIRSWPKWGCPPSKFPWTYDAKETFYLVKGRVKIYPNGSSKYIQIHAGDLVVLPKGMSCIWEVNVAVDKYYTFDP